MNPQMEDMDKAAEEATKEFDVKWTAQQVSDWVNKWYMKAGYKRLMRVLLKAFGHRS